MFEMGVIDPLKVVKSALINASSAAGMLLTTDCLITDIPEKSPAVPAPPDPYGGY